MLVVSQEEVNFSLNNTISRQRRRDSRYFNKKLVNLDNNKRVCMGGRVCE